jgi:hypothetical protein
MQSTTGGGRTTLLRSAPPETLQPNSLTGAHERLEDAMPTVRSNTSSHHDPNNNTSTGMNKYTRTNMRPSTRNRPSTRTCTHTRTSARINIASNHRVVQSRRVVESQDL